MCASPPPSRTRAHTHSAARRRSAGSPSPEETLGIRRNSKSSVSRASLLRRTGMRLGYPFAAGPAGGPPCMNGRNATEVRPAAGVNVVVPAFARQDEAMALARRLPSTARTSARTSEAMLPLVLAGLHELRTDEERPGLAVLAEAVAPYRPGIPVGYFPGRGVEWGSGLEPAPHVAGERARALDALGRGGIVAVSAAAMAERLEPRERRPEAVVVRRGDELERDDLVARLVA